MPVSITFPDIVVFPLDVFHLRRGLLGSSGSRAWASFVQGSTRYAVDLLHEGSGANCVTWNTSLAGATRGQATLAAGARTGAEWAAAFVTAATALGATGLQRTGATVTIATGSSVLTGAPMTYDPTLRGMWGMQRHSFGTATTPNQLGAMGGTGSVHQTTPGLGRIIGVYMRCSGAANVRLGIANGPAYSTTPAAFSGGLEGLSTIGTDPTLRVLRLAEPMAMAAASHKWISFRGVGGGNPSLNYRAFAATPEGRGDTPASEQLLFSTAVSDPATAIYAAGAYTHGSEAGPYSIYAFVGFIYERPVAGEYVGNGGIVTAIGTHATATAGGPTATVPTAMDAETFGMRHLVPWAANVTDVDVAMVGSEADEDLGLAFYNFGDVVAPSVAGATLMRSVGRYGVAGTGYQRHTLATPLPVAANTILAVYFNAGNVDGVTPTDTISVAYDPDTSAAEYWSTAWVDDGRTWNDMDPVGGNGYGQLTEYRTQAFLGGDMPEANPSVAWPSTFAVDASDDNSIRNHLRHRVYLSRDGISSQVLSSGGGRRPVSPALWGS